MTYSDPFLAAAAGHAVDGKPEPVDERADQRQAIPVVRGPSSGDFAIGNRRGPDPRGMYHYARPRSEALPPPLGSPELDRPTIQRRAEAEELSRNASNHAVALRALRTAGYSDTDAVAGAIAVVDALERAGRLA